ncbi:LEA domain-containing protein [Madurella fahalii]|uniref:LEA domain-containing protein n=1 Tax=Madurella fahalii TaxID=1157608 RepID=A0ABQ0GLG7_9PEZI
MSGVAKKVFPPGSWPHSKGDKETAEDRDLATPRSQPPLPKDIGDIGREAKPEGGVGSENISQQSGEYTHKERNAQRKAEDGGEEEEEAPIQMKDDTTTVPGTKMKDVDAKEAEPKEKAKETDHVYDVEQTHDKKQQDDEHETETETKKGDDEEMVTAPVEAEHGTTTTTTTLTEKAKQAFDQASENQPTNDARDAFLKAGRDHLASVSEMKQKETPSADVQTEDRHQSEIPEGEEKPGVLRQDEPTETQQEQTKTESEKAEPEPEAAAEERDFSILKNGTVNKGGNIVNQDGQVVGRVTQGILQHLIGKKVDEKGDIWSSDGKVVGKAEVISDSERDEMLKEPSPFESFPDAVVDKDGMVVSNGEQIGKVVEGNVTVLRGKSVDADGDILDKGGNVIGKAVRWEPEPEPEPEPELEVDKSILAGKRVNKAGNVVDKSGVIFGRVVEGDVKRMVGRMCDKNGNILSESGDILGKAELVPEGEREGLKEGPFAELEGCTVAKDGTVVTPAGDIVGRLVSGDAKILFGRAVDEDGDVLDKNGNTVGKAERWEPEVVERKKNPMCGRRVNREGNVVDEDGNVIGKLTSGDLQKCSGKEIDDDGDVVDYKGNVIGHCNLIEDIPKEPEESPEEKEKREQAEQDRKLAIQMAVCIEQCLDKIRPICKMITEKIDKAERTPEDERDEEQLVKEVRPLIEEGGRILTEAKGIIKGLDPDGRISANAKHKTAAREATPEEYHLAEVLKDLTGDVTQCIDNAKRKLEDMPHAKKELNPLWGLLNEPLFQILAAVGLLLTGVLNLVGRLLSGLGLGGLVDGLLGTLGLNRVLESLGLGSFSQSLKSGKKKGGLLGGVLGG